MSDIVFHDHHWLKGQHAFMGASSYHWLNYDDEKMANVFRNSLAKERGTRLHELACECIELGVKLPRSKKTLNMYVNDAIGYGMKPEQILFYSENCFGTADAILFKNDYLRIHDLKTGMTPASVKQLEIYAALFCLEYNFKPANLGFELRIYQSDEIQIHQPSAEEVRDVMDKIIHFDQLVTRIKEEG